MIIKHVASSESKNILVAIKNLGNKSVKVGWFSGAKYEDGTPVAAIAAQNEYGNPKKNIPERPFLRPTVATKQNNWKKVAEDGALQVLHGKMTIEEVLSLIGSDAVGDIKKTITQIYSPALEESTVLARIARNAGLSKRKGRLTEKAIGNVTKPLIDTKHMLNTLTFELSDE